MSVRRSTQRLQGLWALTMEAPPHANGRASPPPRDVEGAFGFDGYARPDGERARRHLRREATRAELHGPWGDAAPAPGRGATLARRSGSAFTLLVSAAASRGASSCSSRSWTRRAAARRRCRLAGAARRAARRRLAAAALVDGRARTMGRSMRCMPALLRRFAVGGARGARRQTGADPASRRLFFPAWFEAVGGSATAHRRHAPPPTPTARRGRPSPTWRSPLHARRARGGRRRGRAAAGAAVRRAECRTHGRTSWCSLAGLALAGLVRSIYELSTRIYARITATPSRNRQHVDAAPRAFCAMPSDVPATEPVGGQPAAGCPHDCQEDQRHVAGGPQGAHVYAQAPIRTRSTFASDKKGKKVEYKVVRTATASSRARVQDWASGAALYAAPSWSAHGGAYNIAVAARATPAHHAAGCRRRHALLEQFLCAYAQAGDGERARGARVLKMTTTKEDGTTHVARRRRLSRGLGGGASETPSTSRIFNAAPRRARSCASRAPTKKAKTDEAAEGGGGQDAAAASTRAEGASAASAPEAAKA